MIKSRGIDDDFAITQLCYTLWAIWVERNKFTFEGRQVDPERVIKTAAENASCFFSINNPTPNAITEDTIMRQNGKWTPPGTMLLS